MDETQDQVTKDWLLANCIFVNLEHHLYLPEPVIPPMFAPQPLPLPPSSPLFLPSPGAAKGPPPVPTPLSYLDDPISQFTLPPRRRLSINSQTVYLEDLT